MVETARKRGRVDRQLGAAENAQGMVQANGKTLKLTGETNETSWHAAAMGCSPLSRRPIQSRRSASSASCHGDKTKAVNYNGSHVPVNKEAEKKLPRKTALR